MFRWLIECFTGGVNLEQRKVCPKTWLGPPKYNADVDGYSDTSGETYDPVSGTYLANKWGEETLKPILVGNRAIYYKKLKHVPIPGTVFLNVWLDDLRVQHLFFTEKGQARELRRRPADCDMVMDGNCDHVQGQIDLAWSGPHDELELVVEYEYEPHRAEPPPVQIDKEDDYFVVMDEVVDDADLINALEQCPPPPIIQPEPFFDEEEFMRSLASGEVKAQPKSKLAGSKWEVKWADNLQWPILSNPHVPKFSEPKAPVNKDVAAKYEPIPFPGEPIFWVGDAKEPPLPNTKLDPTVHHEVPKADPPKASPPPPVVPVIDFGQPPVITLDVPPLECYTMPPPHEGAFPSEVKQAQPNVQVQDNALMVDQLDQHQVSKAAGLYDQAKMDVEADPLITNAQGDWAQYGYSPREPYKTKVGPWAKCPCGCGEDK